MPPPADAQVEVPGRPLGLADLAAWGWRQRAGHVQVLAARKAEHVDDWATVAKACELALQADPLHLEASWLLAIARAKLGSSELILAPLQVAAAGDFGKWGLASLENPALADFLASPLGAAWRRRVEADRVLFTSVLARAVVVRANGDLFAYDLTGTRWYRITRTGGAVIGALRIGDAKLGYVARTRGESVGVGVIDLVTGKTFAPLDVKASVIAVAAIAAPHGSPVGLDGSDAPRRGSLVVAIGFGAGTPTWRLADPGPKLAPLPTKPKPKPTGPWLAVAGGVPTLHSLPVADVVADWDDRGLASAMRLVKTNRVVSVAGQLVGTSVAWSPDRAAITFVAELTDECVPGQPTTAVYVADAGTGMPRELARAEHGLAVEWVADGQLAIAGDDGVTLVELASDAKTPLVGATDLVSPRHVTACAPPDVVPVELAPLDDEPTATP